jgi:DNA polymerase III subunit gamma/tau
VPYIPLHHKYRPQTFLQLVGQEAIATTLSNALLQNRIAPAYLFTGSRGTGKTSSARILAKSLNCLSSDGPTDLPCGKCETCRTITSGSALDVIEIDAASNTGVDNIRELIERSQFAPVQCRYKVYCIDEVHSLSNAAFNALLKTLEEPPKQVVFILATTDPQRVLPTIISRCQRFDFQRIALEPMVKHLSAIAQNEAIAIAPDALQLVAQISQGGLRDAESLLDQLSLLAGEVTVDRVWDLVGAVPERDLLDLLRAIASDDPETVVDTSRKLMDRGREPLIVLQNLASFYRDLLIAKTSPNRGDLVALTAPTWEQLCDFAKNTDLKAILSGQQHLKTSEIQLKNTTQPRLWLEVTLMGLLPSAVQAPVASETQVAPKPKAIPKPAAPVKAPEPEPIQSAPEPEPSPQQPPDSDLSDLWQKILQNLNPPGTQALLRQQGSLVVLTDEEAQIGINSDKLLNMAQGRIANIKTAVEQTLGHAIAIKLVVAPQTSTSPTNVETSPPANSSPSEKPETPPPVAETPLIEEPTRTEKPSETSPEPLSQLLPESYSTNLPSSWEDDEVTRAAMNLAQAFNGAVVDLESSSVELPAEEISVSEQLTSLNAADPDDPEESEDNYDDF